MSNSTATLLIVDDEPSIRLSLSNVLTELGYRVRCAQDGFSALHEMRNEVPDLLLTDLNMPNMSGFELLSVVRRRFPSIRTIAMSGSFSGDEVPSGVAADGFYQKGSSITALLRIMKALPQIERSTVQTSSPDAPLWVYLNSHDLSPDSSITITCPECLRSFPQTLGTSYLNCKTDCIFCHSSIHYAIVQHAGRMPLQAYQRHAVMARSYPLIGSNSSY
jgi:CheY-like chemotaxis protein